MLPNISVVDDHLAPGSSAFMGSFEPSLAKSLEKTRSSEAEGFVTMSLLSDKSTYSNPSSMKGVADSLLLPSDCKRFVDIGPIQTAEWSMAHIYHVRCNPLNFEIFLSFETEV